MKIHPLFVHFPIALLIVYSLLEIITAIWPKYTEKLQTTKIICLWLWLAGAFVALQTWEFDQHTSKILLYRNILHWHSNLASATTTIYGILTAIYIWQRANTQYANNIYVIKYQNIISQIISIIYKYRLLLILSIVWLILVSIVWWLGGILAYGPDIDPITQFLYGIFG